MNWDSNSVVKFNYGVPGTPYSILDRATEFRGHHTQFLEFRGVHVSFEFRGHEFRGHHTQFLTGLRSFGNAILNSWSSGGCTSAFVRTGGGRKLSMGETRILCGGK